MEKLKKQLMDWSNKVLGIYSSYWGAFINMEFCSGSIRDALALKHLQFCLHLLSI